jgi:hypothetical protein
MQLKTADYTITTDTPPSHYEFSYEQNLYHRSEYLNCQPELPKYSFWLCDHHQIHGVVHFHLSGRRAISHVYAPFGSFNGKQLPNTISGKYISFIEETLVKHGLKEIEFKHQAPIYHTASDWTDVLGKFEYLARHSINHHIVVNDIPLSDKMHAMEKRKLARSQQFRFRLQPLDSLNRIYHFIEACRQERNQRLSMTYESMEKIVRTLPNYFLLCTASFGNTLAAASIVIKVTSRCWYQFYPAHSKKFDKESPLVFLTSKLYEQARKQGVDIIDLGTSEVHERPIEGLLKFKTRIGGISTKKSSYIKTILV